MSYAKPTPEMLKWHELELGLFFHFDIEIYEPEWNWHRDDVPPVEKWNPVHLDTDQWIRTAAAAGARYALLTAKHGTGFCLWPTKQHDYHVGNAPVKRDVVGEFVASCRKYGIQPGLYYSLNGVHLKQLATRADGTLDREGMNKIMLAQVEELILWYGPFCEFWFDGGILRPERGGPDIPTLINRIAPEMPCFGGCPGMQNVIRWSGSEQGVAVEECWSTAHYLDAPERANVTCDSPGDPDDPVWAPVEVDIPSRDVMSAYMGGWMYHADDTAKTYSGDYLFARYLTSVGRNANLTIGCVPDPSGRISPDQAQSFRELGENVQKHLGVHLAQQTQLSEDGIVEIRLDDLADIAFIELSEDQSDGQKVLEWVVETRWPADWCEKDGVDQWIPVAKGQSIGHKRIIQLNLLRGYAFRLRILKSRPDVKIRAMRLYGSYPYTK